MAAQKGFSLNQILKEIEGIYEFRDLIAGKQTAK